MGKVHLTEAAVERYRRPLKNRIEVSDTEPGLFLWVRPTGTKSWMAIFRLPAADGKRIVRRKIVLGRYPVMGVAAARAAARETMALAAEGIDPEIKAAEAKAAEQQAAASRQASSLRTVADEYFAAMSAGKLIGGRKRAVTRATASIRQSLLQRLVLPALGDTPLADVTPTMISRLLARIEKEAGPVDATLKNIRGIFRFAQSRGLFHGLLPTNGMSARQAPVKEVRALSDEELRAVWRAAGKEGQAFGSVIRLLMLTGQRKAEIAGLRWEEVEWDRQLLVIPPERVKNRAGAHEVALTEAALAILRQARDAYDALGLTSGLVFPSETGNTPISGWTQLRRKLDATARAELAGIRMPIGERSARVARCVRRRASVRRMPLRGSPPLRRSLGASTICATPLSPAAAMARRTRRGRLHGRPRSMSFKQR